MLVNILHEAGGLPTANFTVGQFDKHEGVSGETLNALTKERGGEGAVAHGCMSGCVIRCSGILADKKGKFQSKCPEYETLWSFGPHCGIGELDKVSRFDYLCDDFGVDTIDVGVAVGVAMAGGGIPTAMRTRPSRLWKASAKARRWAVCWAAARATTGRVFGVRRVPASRGQSLPAYDPRAVKGVGVTYATPRWAPTTPRLRRHGQYPELRRQGRSAEKGRADRAVPQPADRYGLRGFRGPVPLYRLCHPGRALSSECGHAQRQVRLEAHRRRRGDARSAHPLHGDRLQPPRGASPQAADHLPDFFEDEALPPHNTTFDISRDELKTVFNWIEEK